MIVTVYSKDGRAVAHGNDPKVAIRRGCKIPVRSASRNGAELEVRYFDDSAVKAEFKSCAALEVFVQSNRKTFAGVMA